MKKFLKATSLLLVTAILAQFSVLTVFASSSIQHTTGGALDVELIGTVDSPILSVVMPTQVKFAVLPDASGWNKVISPNFNIQNIGNVMVNVSITKANVITPNVELTKNVPALVGKMRQVRIAVAPKDDTYAGFYRITNYLLHNAINDSNSVLLTEFGLDYAQGYDTAVFKVYGDASSGWATGEQFAIRTVFKVAAK